MSHAWWLVRRELWENRSLYLGPLAVAVVALAGFTVALARLPRTLGALGADAGALREAIQQPYVVSALILMLVEMIVAFVYCLDTLYGDRRDRSVLFWKSLPVSDSATVIAKASIPILLLPLLTFAVTMITQALMLLASSAVLAASGMEVGLLWANVPLLDLAGINLGHLVMFHGLWWAPLYAWLLLVSAWATRVPFVWAILPPVALALAERVAFNTTRFATLLQDHFLGGPVTSNANAGMTMDMLAPHPLMHYVTSPGLWVGGLVTAAMLAAAVRLRRARPAI
ncbi:MAG: ABC transporter permease [Vicinamibacterales bacterium]